jgi:hypothetical protein
MQASTCHKSKLAFGQYDEFLFYGANWSFSSPWVLCCQARKRKKEQKITRMFFFCLSATGVTAPLLSPRRQYVKCDMHAVTLDDNGLIVPPVALPQLS